MVGTFDGMGEVEFVLEGCTGWRYVVEEMVGAGVTAHVAEPAERRPCGGRRAGPKPTELTPATSPVAGGRPGAGIVDPARRGPDARVLVRLYKDLIDERTGWLQRVHATLFHHGVPAAGGSLMTKAGRELLASAELPPAGRCAVDAGMRQVERLTAEMLPLRRQITAIGARQPGCKALQCHYGIGALLSVAIWEELGDCRRFSSSDDAVRHTGLDVTVWSSDGKRTRGHLAKQGPRCCARPSMRPPSTPPGPPPPTTPTTGSSANASRRTWR